MGSTAATAQSVIVQFLNGRSGNPVSKGKPVHVRFYTGEIKHLLTLHTSTQGEVEFDAQSATGFNVTLAGYVPCFGASAVNDYSVAELRGNGLVTTDDCGKLNPQPVPGRLIYFVRSATLLERLESE